MGNVQDRSSLDSCGLGFKSFKTLKGTYFVILASEHFDGLLTTLGANRNCLYNKNFCACLIKTTVVVLY